MARFKGDVLGSAKSAASRLGSKFSGIYSHTRGWELGVRVGGDVTDDGRDVFSVAVTGGSNNGSKAVPILRVEEGPDGETVMTFTIPGDGNQISVTLDREGRVVGREPW